jgi:hypothetical protein
MAKHIYIHKINGREDSEEEENGKPSHGVA